MVTDNAILKNTATYKGINCTTFIEPTTAGYGIQCSLPAAGKVHENDNFKGNLEAEPRETLFN